MSYYSLQNAIYTKIHYLTHDSMEFNQRGKHFSGYEIKLGNYYRAYATKIVSIVHDVLHDF